MVSNFAKWWLLCMIVLLIGWNHEVNGQCLEHQKLLLIKLNQSLTTYNGTIILGYENGRRLLKWDASRDCCAWPGVACSNGYVTGLDLSYESILDGLNNSSPLFDLQYLTSLNMTGSGFQWMTGMPSGFERLVNLMHLNLSYSYFLGRFPVEISNLTRLVTLDLSHNVFSNPMSISNVSLGMLVGNLSKLTQLRLDYVKYLGMQESEWSQVVSSSLPLLKVLSLKYCGLSGPIHVPFQNLTSLSVVDLSENYFNVPFPGVFSSFKYLTSLSLAGCGFFGKISDSLGELKMLSILDLQRCNLESSIPNSFTKLTSLTYLDLSWNSNLSGAIPNSLGELKMLSTLDLKRCNLEGLIPSSLTKLTRLTYVSMSGNSKLSGSIPNSLGELTKLSTLDLAQCNLEGSIPESMSNLQGLSYLDLSYNKLSGSIPSLSKAKNLTYLSLGYNQLTSSILDTDWCELSRLVHVDFEDNSLSGSIPICLFRTPLTLLDISSNHFRNFTSDPKDISSFRLEILDLGHNELQGSFPTFIFRLRTLRLLNVEFNNFSGIFHMEFLQQMANLSVLHISYNHFSVEFGEGLQTFPNLFILGLASCRLKAFPKFLKNNVTFAGLDLSMNQIQGELPNWIWNILSPQSYLNLSHNSLHISESQDKDLQYCGASLIDLSHNKLHGKIPIFPLAQYLDLSRNLFDSSIFATLNMSTLSFLSIANNLLRGSIPKSICNGTLSILDLSSNFLTSTLPSCLLQTESLLLLNLKNNSISGTIPDSFPSICKLHTVILNGNSLLGTIPKSLGNCVALEVLDMGYNKLHDAFPCWMSNILALRVIVLRSNMLQGSIVCPEVNTSWPSLQILDIASNNFSGNLPSQGLLGFKAMIVNQSKPPQLNNTPRYIRNRFGPYSYEITVELTVKGTNLILQKISTYYTLIDLSDNAFEGHIPNEFGYLNDLHVLNISYNDLRGQIPSSLGRMQNLESLDLRKNDLSGKVPVQLANLNFLSVLNLSFNKLEGMIPNGGQLQTFSEYSFLHNKGLCGFPLNISCAKEDEDVLLTETGSRFEGRVLISVEVGYALGLGLIIMPLIFSHSWRMKFFESADRIWLKILNLRTQSTSAGVR